VLRRWIHFISLNHPLLFSPQMAVPTKTKLRVPSVAGATTALVLLTALNFVNYIDRYILPGVQEQVKGEFHVTDAALGSLTFWFFLTYMLAAPATGWLGDRFPRKPLIVGCALLISAVNVLTGTVHSFDSLLFRHAILGIGEASFGIYAPALLSDFYPEADRNRILTISIRPSRWVLLWATSSVSLWERTSAGACLSMSRLSPAF
jgi:MFS family permease